MTVLDDILGRRRGVMTRQEAVKPTPQQAMGQLSQTMPPQSAGTGNQVVVPRRTHQSAAGGAMPVGRSTAPVATNGYTYDQAAEGMKRFHGNVDLYHRPVVSSEAMNNAGYNIPAGNTATVYSMQRGIRDKSGRVREVLYTPITATGEVMSQKDIDAYIDGLDGSDDILAADKAGKGMIIHLDANPNGNDGQDLHLMQEAYGRGPQVSAEGKSEQVPILGRRNYGQQAVDALRDKPRTLQEFAEHPYVQAVGQKMEDANARKRALTYDEVAEQANPGSMTSPTAKLSPNVQLPGVVGKAQQQVAATKQQPAVQTATQQAVDLQPQVSDLAGLTDAMERAKRALDEATETEEDKAAREKREKRQALMAKIGDGLSAFHEAYSYMRGTNPMTSGSLSAEQEARVKALGLERDKKYKDALDNYLAVLEMQRKNDYYNSIAETRKAQQESQDRDRAEKRKETARVNDARVALYNARKGKLIDDSVFNAEYEQAITSGLDEATAINTALAAAKAHQEEQAKQKQAQSDAKVNATNAQANQRNAAASNSKAMAEKRRSGGSSGGAVTTTQDKTVYDKNGNVKGRTVTTTTKQPGRGSNKSSSKGSSGKGNNNGKKQTGLSGQWVK